jgi:hypothetical protein
MFLLLGYIVHVNLCEWKSIAPKIIALQTSKGTIRCNFFALNFHHIKQTFKQLSETVLQTMILCHIGVCYLKKICENINHLDFRYRICLREEINDWLNSEISCYCSGQKVLISCLVSKSKLLKYKVLQFCLNWSNIAMDTEKWKRIVEQVRTHK